ncbi:MAG: alcohol dehydrogenase catalytic domain-containing protein [Shewanella sp.]|uniref:alcohol dehydrogenase catalytic domain-containing protein n=3 Tax=Shewanella sp. TaxID=50422 RepID=UPI003F2F3834
MQPYPIWGYHPQSRSVSLTSAARPTLAPDEVLVQNRVIGINPVDWKFIQANPLHWQQNHVPGVDGAGVIIALGSEVDPQWLGRRVAYHGALKRQGSFAECTPVKVSRLMTLPERLSFEKAAALPCPMLTAWQAFEKIPHRPCLTVLLTGFGAVNHLLAQLLIKAGFTVDVLSTSLKEDKAATLNIRHVYRQLSQITMNYFAIFDAVSGQHAAALVPLLKANGHIICIQDRIPKPIDPPFTRTISYHEIALGALHDFGDSRDWEALMHQGEMLLEQVAMGSLVGSAPVIFEFSQLPEALKHSERTKQKTLVSLNRNEVNAEG